MRILIVGTSFHTVRDYLKEHGFDYVTLRDERITKHPEKRLKRRIVCDFSSEQNILEGVERLRQKYKVDGVIATYENYIRAAAIIARALNLPGMPVEAAEACTDKFKMRNLFARAPQKVSPDFHLVEHEQDITDFAETHSFPLILKPANLAKSLLVTKSRNREELLDNYHAMVEKIGPVYAKYAPHMQPKILIEEFLVGSIHSVDAFVDSQGVAHVLDQVVDYQTGYDIGFEDNFHYSRLLPSALSEKDIQAIRSTAAIGCQALGMKNSPAHVEIILTNDGPRIVEIGARNGGYRDRMHGLANGIDIPGNALKLALGQQPDITASRNDACAVLELFPKQPGTFTGITNADVIKNLPSFVYFDIKAKVGVFVGKASDGYKMCAIVMLHNPSREQFLKDLDFINSQVAVTTVKN